MNKEPKQTEFNSSVATLQRIDSLIKQAHQASRDQFPTTDNDLFYLDTLDRLYVEAQTKFDQEEIEKAIKFQEKLAKIKSKWGKDIYRRYLDVYSRQSNPKFHISRQLLKETAREYEIFLMGAMAYHNMLLSDKERVEEFL